MSVQAGKNYIYQAGGNYAHGTLKAWKRTDALGAKNDQLDKDGKIIGSTFSGQMREVTATYTYLGETGGPTVGALYQFGNEAGVQLPGLWLCKSNGDAWEAGNVIMRESVFEQSPDWAWTTTTSTTTTPGY